MPMTADEARAWLLENQKPHSTGLPRPLEVSLTGDAGPIDLRCKGRGGSNRYPTLDRAKKSLYARTHGKKVKAFFVVAQTVYGDWPIVANFHEED